MVTGGSAGVALLRATALVNAGKKSESDSSVLVGYNIYRTDTSGYPPYYLKTPVPVTGTTWSEVLPNWWDWWTCTYRYYITAVFEDASTNTVLCEPSSDTLLVLVEGISELAASGIELFPNPANQYVNVTGKRKITSVEALNYLSEIIWTCKEIDENSLRIDVGSWSPGVYILKVAGAAGACSLKLVIQH